MENKLKRLRTVGIAAAITGLITAVLGGYTYYESNRLLKKIGDHNFNEFEVGEEIEDATGN